ncbi:MAG: hypothetical protein K0R54_6162, partial [Clostridiaceae bacterium]|nr:hypothetical protein [Clostridiaceae bacterium]
MIEFVILPPVKKITLQVVIFYEPERNTERGTGG